MMTDFLKWESDRKPSGSKEHPPHRSLSMKVDGDRAGLPRLGKSRVLGGTTCFRIEQDRTPRTAAHQDELRAPRPRRLGP